MSNDNQEGNESVQGSPVGSSVPFDSINSPGAYVLKDQVISCEYQMTRSNREDRPS